MLTIESHTQVLDLQNTVESQHFVDALESTVLWEYGGLDREELMAIRRKNPYIWVTWLPKLLSGDNSCDFSAWFRIHHLSGSWSKVRSNFNSARWNAEHTDLLRECADAYRARGYNVFIENQNHFRLQGQTALLSGKPDLIVIPRNEKAGLGCDEPSPAKPDPASPDHAQPRLTAPDHAVPQTRHDEDSGMWNADAMGVESEQGLGSRSKEVQAQQRDRERGLDGDQPSSPLHASPCPTKTNQDVPHLALPDLTRPCQAPPDQARPDSGQSSRSAGHKAIASEDGQDEVSRPVVVSEQRPVIIDIKTGRPKPSDIEQVKLYMFAVPRALGRHRGVVFDGKVQYPDHEVEIPASAVDEAFVGRMAGLIKRLASSEPPPTVPSYQECRFCDITAADCPSRVENEFEAGMTEVF